MAEEAQPQAAVVTPATAKSDTVVDQLRKALKPSKKEREEEIKTKAQARGANEVLKAAGVKKSERARVLEELKAGKLTIAGVKAESEESKVKATQAEADAAAAKAEVATLKAQAAEKDALLKTWADDQFAALPEPLQKFIASTAGDSLDARLKAIRNAKESGLISTQEAAAATAQAKSEVKPSKPANTSNAVNPKAAPATTNLTPRQQYESLREQAKACDDNKLQPGLRRIAAQFYAAHQASIDSDWS